MTQGPSKLGNKDPSHSSRTSPGRAELEVEGTGTFPVDNVATVGRAPESHVVLNARSVSRHHARIFFEGGHFWIKDLDSGNGTSVNGKRVKLQMLGDNDQISFGEAKAVFRTNIRSSGPAALARDPLEGSDPLFQDGTPTGGLKGPLPAASDETYRVRELEFTVEKLRKEAAGREAELGNLYQKLQSLQAENETLRRERGAASGSVPSMAQAELQGEIDRLRRLVVQLERALADSNIKVRNLQERLDRDGR